MIIRQYIPGDFRVVAADLVGGPERLTEKSASGFIYEGPTGGSLHVTGQNIIYPAEPDGYPRRGTVTDVSFYDENGVLVLEISEASLDVRWIPTIEAKPATILTKFKLIVDSFYLPESSDNFPTIYGDIKAVYGGGGNDVINRPANNIPVALFGGAGNDSLYEGSMLNGGAGDDTYYTYHRDIGERDESLYTSRPTIDESGSDADGIDLIVTAYDYDLSKPYVLGDVENITLVGAQHSDISGNALANVLRGNSGRNDLNGRGGADLMIGGESADTYHVDDVGDVVVETGTYGDDSIFTSINYKLAASLSIEQLSVEYGTAASIDIALAGNEFRQYISGHAGRNTLTGLGGGDRLSGLGGDDIYHVDSSDTVQEYSNRGGFDIVVAHTSYTLADKQFIERMQLSRETTPIDRNLTGNSLAQQLLGDDNANRLDGGGGSDAMRGYGGQDVFAFTTAMKAGDVDTIADFTAADDTILLENTFFKRILDGTLTAAAFEANATGVAQDAADRIVYNTATGALFYDYDGNGAYAAVQFAIVTGAPTIGAADFLVV